MSEENTKWLFEEVLRSARFQQPRGFKAKHQWIEERHEPIIHFLANRGRGDIVASSFPDVQKRDAALLIEARGLNQEIRKWLEDNFFDLLTARYLDYLHSLSEKAKEEDSNE